MSDCTIQPNSQLSIAFGASAAADGDSVAAGLLLPLLPPLPAEGLPAIVSERDACGVGFIAHRLAQPSHKLVQEALEALNCMEHRGGCSADRDSGDGAGIMTAIPWQLLAAWATSQGKTLNRDRAAVGMLFLPPDPEELALAKQAVEQVLREEELALVGWRSVPNDPTVLGEQALENLPKIEQVVIESSDTNPLAGDALDRKLYRVRRRLGNAVVEALGHAPHTTSKSLGFYCCSFSDRTIVYKGMVRSEVLGQFYADLRDPAYVSPFAIYHRRFSTNTMPKWPLAQPMRMLGHNGEINTLLGNLNWMLARQADLKHPNWTEKQLADLMPVVSYENSDSANLDNVLELLTRSGRSVLEAVTVLVPEAYENQPDLAAYPEITDYYNYYRGVQESWDGPALLAFSDGKIVGATLDRNGLRPARYCLTQDDFVIVGSEAGVVDLPIERIVEKGRLGPGQAIAVDLETGEVLKNWDLKRRVAQAHPYGEWLRTHQQQLTSQPFTTAKTQTEAELLKLEKAFGFSEEDRDLVIADMATTAKEPTFCMGDDIPLAVLSSKPHLLYDYFKQRFAQVTNPPIDPLREKLVMSLEMHLGRRGNLLVPTPEAARLLKLSSPVLNNAELAKLKESGRSAVTLSTFYGAAAGPESLTLALKALCDRAAAAVRSRAEILILSDRGTLTADTTYIPPLLAIGAVHHHLIRQGLRLQTSLVVDTAQCWSTHHFACLVGYGASAVCPYLAFEAVRHWHGEARTQKLMETGKLEAISIDQALTNYRTAVEGGLLKILSKMGISLLASYHGAQIFEAIGLGSEVINLAFAGTTSRVGGLNLADLAREIMSFHATAFPELTTAKLENRGFVQYRKSGEYHMNSPEMTKALHKAVRGFAAKTAAGQWRDVPGSAEGGEPTTEPTAYDHYEVYKNQLNHRPVTALRDLLDFQSDRPSIDLAEVESIETILQRFCTGGMSLGALSPEAHEVLAIAMNRIGGKSNSGEGGEDPRRYGTIADVDEAGLSPTFPHLKGLRNGDTACSSIKQIASGRFGVTPEYLMSGKQLEIKVAQGAKPGEGGQLPGKKVSPYIAMLRRSKPGVTLISPPPHHDIYSIEDLAQLIYDLHQINPRAQVSVKLVAEIGIGTIAAGVAKANADIIQISGHDGGTGASPLSSIKHAGSPWELGLAEVHKTLIDNKLRDRVVLRVDGGFKTGWDVVMAALLGGEEYGFGTIAMIAEGCIMARVCHTNACPVGVTSQQEHLRKRFPGIPDHVVNFFYFVAQEVRSLLAHLGYRSLSEIIGRADLLSRRAEATLTKTNGIDLRVLTELPDTRSDRSWLDHSSDPHSNGPVLDDEFLANPAIQAAIADQTTVEHQQAIVNTDRSLGARVAGAIAQRYGDSGFGGHLHFHLTGAGGQSFGAFNINGVTLDLIGEANDYVGKGMNGGEIIIRPPVIVRFDPSQNAIVGNTCLYGATGGTLYAAGRAGERFGVRNSRGQAVIEGAGDHCCEYMTGGVIIVLGSTGRNFGAGMTGGLAYVFDEDNTFSNKVNGEIVKLQRVASPAGEEQLKSLIQAHAEKTGSAKATAILTHWATNLAKFWQVVPPSEANTPEANATPPVEDKVATAV